MCVGPVTIARGSGPDSSRSRNGPDEIARPVGDDVFADRQETLVVLGRGPVRRHNPVAAWLDQGVGHFAQFADGRLPWLLVGDDHDLLKSERAAALILGPRSLAEEHPFHFAFAEVGQG